jgi:bacterioferritin-associated ferredoxin
VGGPVYVCVCHAITESEVTASVEAGATTVQALGERTGAGTSCGMCHDHLHAVIVGRATSRAEARPAEGALTG